MHVPAVEPIDGPEIERLITVLLNVTGLVSTIVDDAAADFGDEPDGLAVMAEAGEDLRRLLAPVVEHHDDEELAYVRHFLAVTTLVVAEGLGVGHLFRRPPAC